MTGWQREDYVLRQVKGIAAMLARIIGLRSSGQVEEARVALEEAYGLLGPPAGLARRVDSGTAAALLGPPEKILAFAQLLGEEAAQEGDDSRRAFLRGRAGELCLEALGRDPGNEEAQRLLEDLAPAVDRERLTPAHRAMLEQYRRR